MKARALLRKLGVDLVEYNIETDPSAKRELIRKSGTTSIPFIDVEGTYIRGYSERAIRQAVEKKRR